MIRRASRKFALPSSDGPIIWRNVAKVGAVVRDVDGTVIGLLEAHIPQASVHPAHALAGFVGVSATDESVAENSDADRVAVDAGLGMGREVIS